MQLNVTGGGGGALQIFSEDARLIDTIHLHMDEQLSDVCLDQSEDGIFYVIKILR